MYSHMYVHILSVTSCVNVPVYRHHSAIGYRTCTGHITIEELSHIADSGVSTPAMSCTSCSASISLVPCALLHWCLPCRAVCASLHPFRPASQPLPHDYCTRDSMPILCIALCSIDCRCQISHDNSSHSSFDPVCPTFHAYLTTKEVKCMCAHDP